MPEIVDRIQEAAKGIAAGWGNLDKATSKSDLGRRAQRTLIQILISALYDVAIHHVAAERPLINADQAREIAALARRLGPEQAIESVRDGYEMLRWLDANVNDRLILERLLFRLARSAIMARLSVGTRVAGSTFVRVFLAQPWLISQGAFRRSSRDSPGLG